MKLIMENWRKFRKTISGDEDTVPGPPPGSPSYTPKDQPPPMPALSEPAPLPRPDPNYPDMPGRKLSDFDPDPHKSGKPKTLRIDPMDGLESSEDLMGLVDKAVMRMQKSDAPLNMPELGGLNPQQMGLFASGLERKTEEWQDASPEFHARMAAEIEKIRAQIRARDDKPSI